MQGNNIGNFSVTVSGTNSYVEYNGSDDSTGLLFRSYGNTTMTLTASRQILDREG